jgi:hypothetical protein
MVLGLVTAENQAGITAAKGEGIAHHIIKRALSGDLMALD